VIVMPPWHAPSQTSVPLGFFVSKVIKLAGQTVSLQAGPRYYAESADNGPEGWGFRINLTLLFPK
jgi:hypothetical protein